MFRGEVAYVSRRKGGEGRGELTGKLFPHMGFVLQKEGKRKEQVDRKDLSAHRIRAFQAQIHGTTILIKAMIKCIRCLVPSVR
jgi:hypothetical protein